jgi:polygalacturonase
VKINNEWWAQNGDGIDINSYKNVLVYKCTVTAGDDAICMKSGKKKNSREPSLSNIVVADCIVYHGHGGFAIGSDTDGGMKNISVKNYEVNESFKIKLATHIFI